VPAPSASFSPADPTSSAPRISEAMAGSMRRGS
jgi:hypothetical protein